MPSHKSEPDAWWRSPPTTPILKPNEVHLWTVTLDRSDADVQRYAAMLASDEHARAKRFHFERDRRRFIVARGVLRAILARYLGSTPADLQFGYGPQGKPYLAAPPHASHLRFNTSHSGDVALYGLTLSREIGVDIEHVRDLPDADRIAERFFSASEVRTLRSIPAADRKLAFFTCWTRKEAYVKARGDGLSLALDQFDVSVTPDAPAALLRTRFDSNEAERWSMQAVNPMPGYVATVAFEGHDCFIVGWRWPA